MKCRTVLLAWVLFSVPSYAQPGGAAKAPKAKDDTPAGYSKDNLRGFTLYFSDEVLAQDKMSKLERKPLEALEQELIVVERVLPADKIKHLKAIPIWVEWDEEIDLKGLNARNGRALAVFYGGHQANLLRADKDQRKSNAVTILSLKLLTEEHQPKRDSGRCVTLHELAHAFHYYVHRNSPLIQQTFRQAMERKLYEPEMYAATNDREYFAEITCAYLDRLSYFPRNRDELKKHDPKGYELMETIWGKVPQRRERSAVKGPKLPTPDGDGKFSLDTNLERLEPGATIVGTVPPKSDWKGRPVLLCLFPAGHSPSEAILTRINPWYIDLRDHGLIVLGSETSEADELAVKKVASERGFEFPVIGRSRFGIAGTFNLPHALLYDHTGKCVFRGNPLDAEPHVRVAVGKAVLAKTERETFARSTESVVDLLEAGSPMPAVFSKLNEQIRRATGDAAAELKQLQEILTAGGIRTLEAARARSKDDPVGAYFEIERLPAAYRGTPVEKGATQMLVKLRGTAKVENEMRARPSLEAIRKLDAQLAGRDRSFNPRLPEFQAANAPLLKQLNEAVEKMKRAYPNMRATQEAIRIADRWVAAAK